MFCEVSVPSHKDCGFQILFVTLLSYFAYDVSVIRYSLLEVFETFLTVRIEMFGQLWNMSLWLAF